MRANRSEWCGAAQGRVGKLMVAKMLCGSQSQQIGKLKLDQLSTFGLLKQLRQTETAALFDALLKVKLIQQKENQRMRPVVELTAMGKRVMTGQLRLDRPLPLPEGLKRQLRNLHLPAPVTSVPEAHASQTAAASPSRSREQVATVAQSQPVAAPAAMQSRDEPAVQPEWYWTWKVFAAGCTVSECERIRQLDRTKIHEHLLAAADAGRQVPAAWVLSPQQQTQLEGVIAIGGQATYEELEKLLPDTVDATQLRLLLRWREQSQEDVVQ